MTPSPFWMNLKKRFSQDVWSWLILALRQDSVVWHELEERDLGQRALEALPGSAEKWTPAALCRLANDGSPLAQAGKFASALVEKYHQAGSWGELLSDQENLGEFPSTVVACLLGMVREPLNVLRSLLKPAQGEPKYALALHALLSNPLSGEEQASLLNILMQGEPLPRWVGLLRELARQRPWLAAELADGLLRHPEMSAAQGVLGRGKHNPENLDVQFDELSNDFRLAELHQIASQPTRAVAKLTEALKKARRLQGHLSAQLAHFLGIPKGMDDENQPQALEEAGLEAWKQAVEIAPQDPLYSGRFALALAKAGRFDAAKNILSESSAPAEQPSHAAQWLAAAWLDFQGGQVESASQHASMALDALASGQPLDQKEFVELVNLLLKLGHPEQAAHAAQIGLERYPVQRDLLALQVKAYQSLGFHKQALPKLLLLMAVDELSAAKKNVEERQSLQRQFISSLEALGHWEDALRERDELMSKLKAPSVEDYQALATCALHAGKSRWALEACRRAIALAPKEVNSHLLMAQIAVEQQDYPLAIEICQQLTGSAPHLSEAWLLLAKAYQSHGQAQRALEILQAACQALPEEARVHTALGEAYLQQSAWTQALAALRRAAMLSDSPYIALLLGRALIHLGHHLEANQTLEKAYEVVSQKKSAGQGLGGSKWDNQTHADLAYTYAQSLLALDKKAQALPLLAEVVQTLPNEVPPVLDFARLLLELDPSPKDAQRVVALLAHTLEILDQKLANHNEAEASVQLKLRTQALVYLAEAYAAAQAYGQAFETYQQVMNSPIIEQLGWQARLATGFGRAALKINQPEAAIIALREMAQGQLRNLAVQQTLAEAYLASGLHQEAFQTANTALEMNPSDVEALAWFVQLGRGILASNAGKRLDILPKLIYALQCATQLAPWRQDLCLQLGELLLSNGNQVEAREVLQRLAAEIGDRDTLAIDELSRAAKALCQLDDAPSAVHLLQRAIDRVTAQASDHQGDEVKTLLELWRELARAHHQAGNTEAALQSIGQALLLNSEDLELYLYQADLLQELDKPQDALECLQTALRTYPHQARLHLRLALVLRWLGNLSTALDHAQQAILHASDGKETSILGQACLLAAELAYVMLRPQQARSFLLEHSTGEEEQGDGLGLAYLQAELALDASEDSLAGDYVDRVSALAPQHPRSLAIQSRLAHLQGDGEIAQNLFRQAIEQWRLSEPSEGMPQSLGSRMDNLATLRGLLIAALDLFEWEEALILAQKLLLHAPLEPLSHLLLTRVLVSRAEIQSLYQDLDIKCHAAGEAALDVPSRQNFEQAIFTAEQQIDKLATNPLTQASQWWGSEASQILSKWRARGQAVFQPSALSAQALDRVLRVVTPMPEDVAALVMVFRHIGELASAVRLSHEEHLTVFQGVHISAHPLVMTQMALAFEESDPQQAIEMIEHALKNVVHVAWGGSVTAPMLYYLSARIAYRLGNLIQALQMIHFALQSYPDEPRWQRLAAEIYLSQDANLALPDLAKAIHHLEKATLHESEQASHFLVLGRAYLQLGDVSQAIAALEKASQLDAQQTEVWLLLAEAQQKAGKLEQAGVSADHAVDCASGKGMDTTAPMLRRGEIDLQLKRPRAAFHRAQAILRLQPNHTEALLLLAHSLEAMERSAEALAVLEKAISQAENPLPIQLERVHMLHRTQGLEVALVALQELVAFHPKHPFLLALLADWLNQTGKVEAAVQAARWALQDNHGQLTSQQLSQLHSLIGRAMQQVGQLDQAIDHLDEALRCSPDDLELYLALGQTFQARRDYKNALATYDKAIEIAGGDHRPYYQAGLVLKDSKRYQEAEDMLRHAAQLAPNDVNIHRLLAAVVALNLVHNRRPVSAGV